MGLGQDVAELEAEAEAGGAGTEVAPGQLTLFQLESGLPTLLKMSLTFAAIGIAALAVALVQTIGNLAQRATSWLPFFGKSIDSALRHGVQVLTSSIGAQYNGIDQEIGAGLQEITTELRLLGADIFAVSFVSYQLVRLIAALKKVPDLAPVVNNVQTTVKAQTTKVTNLTTKVVHITEIIRRPANPHEAQEIHTLQAQVKQLTKQVVALQTQTAPAANPSSLTSAASVVALGLAGLGLNASRCEGTRAFNNALCESGPQGLNRLTSLLGLGALFLTLPELARAEYAIVKDASDLIRAYWKV